jgi:nucleotide-binding universal stress UspA family protein
MFRKILLPTDGSELSLKAINAAAALAKQLGATLVGFTVVEPYSYTGVSEYRPESLDDFNARMDELANKRLAVVKSVASEQGVTCETHAARSQLPYEAIIDAAKRQGCDLICMASHGRSGLSALLLGSETQKVLTHSSIPVLVYR